MLCKRIIACLDVRDGQVVKGVNFEGLREAGDPAALARRYDAEGIDEIVILDVTATIEGRQARARTIAAVAREIFLPLTVGGGIRTEADAKIVALHRRFVARLAVELAPDQVGRVKDGLTYGVVPITYAAYRKLLPDLTDEQAREVLANLLEAREYAMDAGSSEEKHAWFGKYKGRINNYLSRAGYDLKAAEQAARKKVT